MDKADFKKFVRNLDDKKVIAVLQGFGISQEFIDFLFARLSRKFKYNPKGYPDPKAIARQLVFHTPSMFDRVCEDMVIQAKSQIICQAIDSEIPIPWYFISKNLAEDLDLTDLPEEIPANLILPDIGLLVLPKKFMQVTGGQVDFLAYKLFRPGEDTQFKVICESGVKFCTTSFLGEEGYRLCWFAPDRSGCLYGGIVGLNPAEFGLKLDNNVTIIQDDASIETKETNRLTAFLVNVLTYASQNSSRTASGGNHASSYNGGHLRNGLASQDRTRSSIRSQTNWRSSGVNPSDRKINSFSPLFIGENYKKVAYNSVRTSHGGESAGKGTSPRRHYRRGHWRRSAIGKNRQQREWRLIPPTVVGLGEKNK